MSQSKQANELLAAVASSFFAALAQTLSPKAAK